MVSRDGEGRPTLVVGLGSPILCDDAVGLHVARALADRLPPGQFEVVEAGAAGLRLLLVLDGYDRAVIIDALVAPPNGSPAEPGRLHQLPVTQLHSTLTLNTSHEASLADTLRLGQMTGMRLPQEIAVFGIEVVDPFTFAEEMTPAVAAAVEPAADAIAAWCCEG